MTEARRTDPAERLRSLARAVEGGHYRLPAPGVGPDPAGLVVVVDAVHALRCGRQTHAPHPDLVHEAECPSCGWLVVTLPRTRRPS